MCTNNQVVTKSFPSRSLLSCCAFSSFRMWAGLHSLSASCLCVGVNKFMKFLLPFATRYSLTPSGRSPIHGGLQSWVVWLVVSAGSRMWQSKSKAEGKEKRWLPRFLTRLRIRFPLGVTLFSASSSCHSLICLSATQKAFNILISYIYTYMLSAIKSPHNADTPSRMDSKKCICSKAVLF